MLGNDAFDWCAVSCRLLLFAQTFIKLILLKL